jgi:hypothetical protein
VIRVIRIGVDGGVKLRTNREQSQHPNEKRAESRDPAKGRCRFRFGA